MFLSVARLVRVASLIALTSLGGQTLGVIAASHGNTPTRGAIGRDVGHLSCSTALPRGGSFAVLGTTAGKPFFPSTCLASEYAWAKNLTYRPQFYINLANPGHKSSHWGRGGPKVCHHKPKYDVGCAYDYGYETAATAWGYVRAIGSSGAGHWWLDVEIDNSWGYRHGGTAANIADIRGALRYLRGRSHTSTGIYTETTWWDQITAGSTKFSKVPVWGGGANSKRHAASNCKAHSITGGPAELAQWIVGTADHDIAC